MSASLETLEAGDIVEIRYRVWRARPGDCEGEDVIDRWIVATVTACEDGTWPLARLTDGQVTEIRPFMTWRCVSKSRRRARSPIAA